MSTFELLDRELDIAGVHAALLPNGTVLFLAAFPPEENNVNLSLFQLWSEEEGPLTRRSQRLNRNLFCSGHCFLPDGRILFAAGQSNNFPVSGSPGPGVRGADHDIHTFNFDSEDFSAHEDMPAARYYPSCVTLPDGNGLICSGAWSRTDSIGVTSINHDAEIFYWKTNEKGNPFPFDPGFIETMYPFLQVLPDRNGKGNLFVFSKNRSRLFNLNNFTWLDGEFPARSTKNRNYHHQGSCVLLPFKANAKKLKIMVIGGEGNSHDIATNTAEIFEYDANNPQNSTWRAPDGGRMNNRRFMGDSVIMADGKILIVNGAREGAADHSGDPVLEAEIFNPDDETFTAIDSIHNERMYHSTALLLPSGRVLIAGNTRAWNPANPVEDKSIELFTPDYVLSDERPTIQSSPKQIFYEGDFQLTVDDALLISKVAIIRCSTVTHTNNMDQRYIKLDFDITDPTTLRVEAPKSGSVAPPGPYMVVVINQDNIPSEAKIFKIMPDSFEEKFVVDVRESDGDVSTPVKVKEGDKIEITATGTIWAGVYLTGRNGPEGWNNLDHDPKFPLNTGTQAHPFSLIGKLGRGGSYFYVGKRLTKTARGSRLSRLFLRTNDDSPGNGDGKFTCTIKVFRAKEESSIIISRVVPNPLGSDLRFNAGEFIVLENTRNAQRSLNNFKIVDLAGHEIILTNVTIGANAEFFVHIGRGRNSANRFFAGRSGRILNNDGDTLRLFNADGELIGIFSY